MEFQEKRKVQVLLDSTGATTEQFTPYVSMLGYRRADFLVSGLVNLSAAGAAGGSTGIQQFTCRVMQASNSTGGGATALSSATAIIGKNAASGISTAAKCREGRIIFGTLDKATNLTLTVGTAAYQTASAATTANRFVVKEASANASVAAENFVAMFNAATNNTATAVTAKWQAATIAGGGGACRIFPKDQDGTDLLILGATTGGTMVGLGGVFEAHIGVDAQYLTDGKTHVALGVLSTINANPFTVTLVREKEQGPVRAVTYSKSLNSSTSK